MPRTGRPPKPTVLKLLAGNPGKRAVNRREPKLPSDPTMAPPSWLTRAAKDEWRRVIKLVPAGLITKGDRQVFAQYCQCVARLAEAERAITTHGMTFETDKGYLVPRPEVTIARQMHMVLRGLESDLGLTPSSRSRIQMPEPPRKTDATAELLFGGKGGG